MSPEMRPLNHTVTYTVHDKNRNLIMMKKNQPLEMGVASDEIEIHPNADHGSWEIKFTDDVIVSLVADVITVLAYFMVRFVD